MVGLAALFNQTTRNRTFDDLTNREKQDFFNKTQTQGIDETASNRLREKLALLESNGLNEDQRASVDKRILALSSSLNPNELSRDVRDKLALANEREAARREKFESQTATWQAEHLAVQRELLAVQQGFLKIAQEGGLQKLEIILKDEGATVANLGSSPTNADTQRAF
jgi:hypothetical protein